MGREIKFRAWHRGNKDMRYVWDGWSEDCDILEEVWLVAKDAYGYEIMQFTGLKDKNGKEIWEGDIVTAGSLVCEVVWKDSGWKAKWYQTRHGVREMSCHPDLGFRKHEVIGNIYENPELLNG